MTPPRFAHCLVCEGVRQEVGNKITILGFMGICPDVEIRLARLDLPTALFFVLIGGFGDANHRAHLDIRDESTGATIAATASQPLTASNDSRTLLGAAIPVMFRHAGRFAIRLIVDGEVQFKGEFNVDQADDATSSLSQRATS